MKPLLFFVIFLLTDLGSDACSRRRKSSQMSRLPPNEPAAEQCGCVPLHTCPLFNQVLQGPRPLSNSQLTSLRRATCDPIGDPKNPNVKCCDKYLNEIDLGLSSVTEKTTPDPALPETTTSDPVDYENQCGQCEPSLDPRIVGGLEAKIGQFPWIARLGYMEARSEERKAKDAEFLCGGSLISHFHVLTAAHCVDRAKHLSQLKWIKLGEHDERSDPDCSADEGCAPATQDLKVEWAEPHPNYRSSSFRNDIAIVKLQESVNFTHWVHPICLPSTRKATNLTGVAAVVAGWGTNMPGTTGSVPVLQYLWKRIVASEVCTNQYRGITTLNQGQMCASGKKGTDSCNGDSGGPLARIESDPADDGNGHFTLLGVVSFGTKLCGSGGLPGVYSNVTNYMNWIRQVTSDGWSPKSERAIRWD